MDEKQLGNPTQVDNQNGGNTIFDSHNNFFRSNNRPNNPPVERDTSKVDDFLSATMAEILSQKRSSPEPMLEDRLTPDLPHRTDYRVLRRPGAESDISIRYDGSSRCVTPEGNTIISKAQVRPGRAHAVLQTPDGNLFFEGNYDRNASESNRQKQLILAQHCLRRRIQSDQHFENQANSDPRTKDNHIRFGLFRSNDFQRNVEHFQKHSSGDFSDDAGEFENEAADYVAFYEAKSP